MAKSQDGMEHERRFFPNLETWVFDPNYFKETFILQGYLESKPKSRIRRTVIDGSCIYTRTVKKGGGISRHEEETEISKGAFDSFWKSISCSLEKSRYFIPLDSEGVQLAEINIFHGPLEGYVQIEVEFISREEALAFEPPGWFGKEVTDDPRHGNYSLAKNGCQKLIS